MSKILIWNKNHPWLVLFVVTIITIFFAYHAVDLRIDGSTHRMMIADDPDLEYYHKMVSTFGSDNITFVYCWDENLFSPEKLNLIKGICEKLQNIEGVLKIDSLFTSKNPRFLFGFLNTTPLLKEIPKDIKKIEEIKQKALGNPMMKDRLITRDGKGILLSISAVDDKKREFDKRITPAINEMIAPLQGKVAKVFQIGPPLVKRSVVNSIISDQRTLIPIAVLVLLVTLTIGLKTLNGALLTMLTGGLAIVWTFGFMVLCDIPVQILTVIVPPIILVLGATENMHIISEYFEGLEEDENRMQAIDYMASKIGLAIALTGLSTFLGFLSITINEMVLLQEFGVVASFGILINFILTLALAPIYLKWFGEKKSPFAKKTDKQQKTNLYDFCAQQSIWLVKKGKIATFLCVIAVVAIAIYGIQYIKVDNDLLGYFRQNSPIRQHARVLHNNNVGVEAFFVVFDGEKNTFNKAENLERIFAIQQYIEKSKDFDMATSFTNQLALVYNAMKKGENYRIPDDEWLKQYLRFFPRDDIKDYVTSDYKSLNLIIQHHLTSSYEFKEALKELDSVIQENLKNTKIDYRYTGETILLHKAADSIAINQAKSITLLMIVIFIIMCFLFVNIKAGILSLIPNAIPVVALFGVMGWFQIPLNPGTAMIAAVAIGISVDDTIHFMVRYHKEMKIHNDQITAMVNTINSETRPVMSTSIALALGFASLAFSNFLPLVYFGLLSAFVMIKALITDLLVTPTLLISTKLITLWDILMLKADIIKNSPLFCDMNTWQMKKIILLGHTREFQDGDAIVKQGEKGRQMYLILEGETLVRIKNESGKTTVINKFKPGEIFGEIALVSEVSRTADVIASAEKTKVLEINWDSLELIRKIYPYISSKLFLNIAKILGQRLAQTDDRYFVK